MTIDGGLYYNPVQRLMAFKLKSFAKVDDVLTFKTEILPKGLMTY